MSDGLILWGILAIAVERATEVLMNAFKWWNNEPRKGNGNKQVHLTVYRLVAMFISGGFGILITGMWNIDLFKLTVSEAAVQNGVLLSGLMIGLGALPSHEIIKYIEEKKGKAKADADKSA